MAQHRYCDICDRSEADLRAQKTNESPVLEIDSDGLWICGDCRSRLTTSPVGEQDDSILLEELGALVGQSAGAICYVLNLPYEPPYRSVIDAASLIAYDQDLYLSGWAFVTQWMDGTTVWRSEDGTATVIVGADGSVEKMSR